MGRKRKHPKHKQTKPKWYQREDEWGNFVFDWSLGLSGEAWREIFAVLIIIISAVIFMGFFGSAGWLGAKISGIVKDNFGPAGGYFFAIGLFYIGFTFMIPPKSGYPIARYIGITLFVAAFTIFLHLFIPAKETLKAAAHGQGGGQIGYALSEPLREGIGLFPSFLLSVALIAVAAVMIFNISVSRLLGQVDEEDDGKGSKVNVNQANAGKTSMLDAMKKKLGGMRRRPTEVAPTAPVIEVSARGQDQPARRDTAWEYPPIDILKDTDEVASSGNIQKNAEIIQKTLKNFGIETSMGDVNIGPTVTQYTLKPNEGVKLNQIVARQNDLALALSAKSLRVEAPIPGKNAVGIEIPNKIAAKVTLREVLVSPQFKSVKSKLAMAIGRDVAGEPVSIDLEKMPHMLVAGSTGSGKSVCINSIIVALLYNNAPSDLKLILVDPKRVEMTGYNGVPHLLTPAITEVDKTVSALKWAVHEMERRYDMFSKLGKRNIGAYNAAPGEEGKLPYIVIIIDELADLMATSAKEVEGSIVRLAQMARAVGIHLLVATQRPSVDVLTGLIKANIPARIAFATASQVDSRTILDMSGAEKLLGNGDMLFMGNGIDKPRRVQGCYVSDSEIEELNNFLRGKGPAEYDEHILNFRSAKPGASGGMTGDGAAEDDLYEEAVETVVRAGKASASLLQRRLRIGYARAARLLDILEEAGVIGPAEGAKPRDVLITKTGSEAFQPGGDDVPVDDFSNWSN